MKHQRRRGVSFYGSGRGSSSSRSETPSRPFPENLFQDQPFRESNLFHDPTFRETNRFPYSRPQSDLLYNNSSASTASSSLSEYLKRRPRSEMVLEAVSQIHERMMRANGPREDPFPGYPYPTFREDGRPPGYTCPLFRERGHCNHNGLESPRLLMEEGEYETIGDTGKTRDDTNRAEWM